MNKDKGSQVGTTGNCWWLTWCSTLFGHSTNLDKCFLWQRAKEATHSIKNLPLETNFWKCNLFL